MDVGHYADVIFQPLSRQGTIAKSGKYTIQIFGVFTLHDTPHDIAVPMQVHIDGANMTAKMELTSLSAANESCQRRVAGA